jgi:hypothetical protein
MVQILRSTERISSFKCNAVVHLIRVVGMADPSSCHWRCADCGKCFKSMHALKVHQRMSERCASGASEKTTQPSSDVAAESSGESMFYCHGRLVEQCQ